MDQWITMSATVMGSAFKNRAASLQPLNQNEVRVSIQIYPNLRLLPPRPKVACATARNGSKLRGTSTWLFGLARNRPGARSDCSNLPRSHNSFQNGCSSLPRNYKGAPTGWSNCGGPGVPNPHPKLSLCQLVLRITLLCTTSM